MLFEATVDGQAHAVFLQPSGEGFVLHIDSRPLEIDVLAHDEHFLSLLVAGRRYELGLEPQPEGYRVSSAEGSVEVRIAEGRPRAASVVRRAAGAARLTAPMPGRVVRVLVAPGDHVQQGQGMVVVEAMKMENELRAPRDGRVEQVAVREGQTVEAGVLLVVVA